MRLTIRKRKKYRNTKERSLILISFVIIPLISISLGLIFAKKVIMPYLSKKTATYSEEYNKKIVEKSQSKLTRMYNIEVDRFPSLIEAERFLKKLNNENRFAYVSRMDDYVVYTSLTFDKNEIERAILDIKKNHSKAKINIVDISPKDIDTRESEKNVLKKVLNTTDLLNQSYKSEISTWTNGIKEIDYTKFRDEIDKNNIKISKSLESYSELFLSDKVDNEELKSFYLILSKNLENRRNIVREFNTEDIVFIKKSYYNFIETLFTYINYYKI